MFDLLRLRTKREGRTHVVSARGELDLFSRAALERELRLARASDAERIVLDLSGLTYMDCAGLQGDPLHGRPVERPARPLPRTARTGKHRSCLLDHQRRPTALVPDMTSVAIVGGGFGGIGAAVMLSREGYHDVTVFERGDRVGGVWNFNTYPGIACDVPSHLYEFSFAPNPNWSRRYAPGAEIQAYMEDVARRHGVLDRVRLRTEVTGAAFDEQRGRWLLETTAGPHEADVLVAACGQLSVPSIPAIPGLDDFAGPAFHTARWRDDVDARGQAGGARGHRLQLDSGGPVHPARGCAARRLPALARLDDPEDGLRVRPAGAPAVRARRRCCSGSIAS